MGSRTKKVIGFLIVAFFVYAIFVAPEQAANILQSIWNIIVEAFYALLAFFDALLNG